MLSGEECDTEKTYLYDFGDKSFDIAADSGEGYVSSRKKLEDAINRTRQAMESAARDLDFTTAAKFRDQMYALQEKFRNIKKQ